MSDGTDTEPIAAEPAVTQIAPGGSAPATANPSVAIKGGASAQKPTSQPAPEVKPAPAPGNPAWQTLWLTDRDVTVFAVLGAIVLVLLVVRWGQLSGWGMREIEIERLSPLEYSYRVDINSATWVELSQLNGIGESLATRIVEDRETNGRFGSVDDLDRVKGIGPKTIDRLRPYLRVGQEESPHSQ